MKKLYINFVLLFTFLAFAPSFVRAYRLREPSPEEIARYKQELQLAKEQSKKDIQCVLRKKADLSKKYKGPNLKIEKDTPRVFLKRDIYPSTKNIYYVDTYLKVLNRFSGEYRFPSDYNRPVFGLRVESGLAYDCKEYIVLNIEGLPRAYDVTNVPPGSYLKYIPETNEFQVLPPTEESYSKIVKNQKEYFKARNERLKTERNKRFAEIHNSEHLKQKTEDTLCVWEKKSNLKEYRGPNLKFGPIICDVVHGSVPLLFPRFEYLTDVKLEEKELQNMIPGYKILEPNVSGRSYFDSQNLPRIFDGTSSSWINTFPQKHVVKSHICGCKEYINITYWNYIPYGYDITNVPPGSYLKFIPETKELQVISPKDSTYEEMIKNQKDPWNFTYYDADLDELKVANRVGIILLNKETYKDFVENEQSKVKELKPELKKYAEKLKKEMETDKAK